jgi:hypothetical protein
VYGSTALYIQVTPVEAVSGDNVWKEYGTGNLKVPGDADFIDSRLLGDLDDYRYFAR